MYPFRHSATGGKPGEERLGVFVLRLQTFAALLLAGVLLATPALVNRFPFIFYDSSSYISRATVVTHPGVRAAHRRAAAQPPANQTGANASSFTEHSYRTISRNPFFLRPITYSVLLVPFSIPPLFYLLPLAQGFFCAYVIRRLCTTLSIEGWKPFFAIIGGLTILSSLPLHVSYVMPDVFTGLLVVMSFVTVFAWPQRSAPGRALDVLLMTGLVAVHLSHLPITLALIVLYAIGAMALRREVKPAAVAFGAIAPFVLAIGLLAGSNYAVARHAIISESSPLFLLARLIGDGPAVAYLQQHCAQDHYLLCDHLDGLRAVGPGESISDHFLWDPEGAVKTIADPRLLAEAAKIDSGTIREYPMQMVGNVLRNGLRQLVHFQVDVDVNSEPAPFVVKSLREVGPGLVQPYLHSPQAHGLVPIGPARLLIATGLALAFAAVAWVGVTKRRAAGASAWAFVFIAAAGFSANALATGGLSEVHDRYGNRVVWILPLAALVLLCAARRRAAAPRA